MIIKSILLEEDTRFGNRFEYQDGQPVRYKYVHMATVQVKYGPIVTLDFVLSEDDAQKIVDIVKAATKVVLDTVLGEN